MTIQAGATSIIAMDKVGKVESLENGDFELSSTRFYHFN